MNSMKFFILSLLSLLLINCSHQKVNQTSNERLYKKDNNELVSQYVIYHVNDTISQLFYKLSNENVMYKKTDTSEAFYSDVKILLKISTEDNLAKTHDTASAVIRDKQSDVKIKNFTGSLYIKLNSGLKYNIEVEVFDANKKKHYSSSVYADKTSKELRQNFLLTNWQGEIYFDSYFKPEDVVYIKSDRNKEPLFTVDYFNPSFNMPFPPFSVSQMPHYSYKPDYSQNLYSKNNQFELSLPKSGFVHLKTNEQTKDGVTFFVYETTFPKIKNAEQMILATRYIMAKKEFDNCMDAADKKAAIDQFWLDVAGSNERAKELIRKYYGRVQEANRLFTSYQEGWKTDRGMLYVVFGAPNRVTKRKNGEVWTYGEMGNPNSIVFSFIKVINPFTDNDFYLERNELFKMPWYQAVDMWRQGRIYLDN